MRRTGSSRPAAALPDAIPWGFLPIGPDGARPAGADPFPAAGVAFSLLFEPLLECLEKLVEAAQRFDQSFVVIRQMAEKLLAQPFFRYPGADVEDGVDALEVTAEREVEAVEMLFVLDQAGARQRIE